MVFVSGEKKRITAYIILKTVGLLLRGPNHFHGSARHINTVMCGAGGGGAGKLLPCCQRSASERAFLGEGEGGRG